MPAKKKNQPQTEEIKTVEPENQTNIFDDGLSGVAVEDAAQDGAKKKPKFKAARVDEAATKSNPKKRAKLKAAKTENAEEHYEVSYDPSLPVNYSESKPVFDRENMEIIDAEEPPEAEKNDKKEKTILKAQKRKKHKIVSSDIEKAERYNPSFESGLTAAQVEKRNLEGYVNFTNKKNGKTYKSIFFSNIFTFFNILTFIVAGVLTTANVLSKESLSTILFQLVFLIIIIANISIGIIQEIRSKLKIDKLKLVTAPSATVVRAGERKVIAISEIVLDDIVYLETGKQISTDSVVVSGQCEVNESMLTGESEPVKKNIGDKLYSGTYINSGSCYARADTVGDNNYIEALTSHAKRYKKPQSQLQHSIRLIMKIVTCFIIPITIAMLYGVIMSATGLTLSDTLLKIQRWAGSIIGMIPAGMLLLTSLALAVGMVRLANRNALVQDLYCIEMLARANVLCLDKTGTLTDGSMQVNKVVPLFKEENAEGKLSKIIGSMLTATDDNNQTALALAAKFGYNTMMMPQKVLPFSSARKYSAVTFADEGTYVLGAPEFVLKDMGIRLEKLVAEYAGQGYRVLCLAQATGDISSDGKLPSSRRPLALIVIEDHIREDAVETIRKFKENGVAVKVISGDNPITVSEVAKRVGIDNAELFISLDGLSSQEVIESADRYTVFGRVTPEQKSLLIRALKAKGNTVAMTGDGVNDILAMREADCSIAIASGAEAARNASHLVLLDSNFTSMPDVVNEGRRVVNNITKSSALFLTKTFMSIVLSIIFLFIDEEYPFTTNNLLMLEIFVIGIPSFSLALQANNSKIKGNFLLNVISRAIPGGLALVISVMAIYLYGIGIDSKGWLSIADFDTIRSSLWVLSLSFTGAVVLSKICEPFNFFRIFVFFISIGLMFIIMSIPAIAQAFGIKGLDFFASELDLLHMLFLICIVLMSYFIITVITRVLKSLNVMTD